MRDEREQTRRRGQPNGANSARGAQLACLTGIDGLQYLTDDECDALIEFMNFLDALAANEGFRAGCDAMSLYNHDQRLLDVGPPTNR